MENNEVKQRFIELRAKGNSYDKIAQELGISKQTLINWSKEFEFMILNLKTIALEALQEEFYVTKEKRIKVVGEILKAIKEELSKRDLAVLSTEKLLDFLIKYYLIIKGEEIEIVFQKKAEEFDNSVFDQSKKWRA